ncbi:aminotransferase class I/II-fold pyridoxal phosphate-dependent enzyme [Aurantibacter aestuarii]|uniref:8-amino-7-oxononanoate synthase n=1 Tax=Aurantibacter aestuarii TaxID=1266046 RepID=A0A2T1NDU6_9FLAO|nr:pyridoxal phosphate-dependent aminotransferase family protein [Aurantibacter aestuarii]PSG90556.1 8-amino-7-oxononanoate synthase [Aurantibacter aestuarii]
MQDLNPKLIQKLEQRLANQSLRQLGLPSHLVDFSSNDYLGFAKNKNIYNSTLELLHNSKVELNGSGGSRLLTGNHSLYELAELTISKFHQTTSATIYNSGYNANIGVLSCVPQRNDVILYDEFCHASIREGIDMSHAKSYKFQHNNLEDLELKLKKFSSYDTTYIVTESVFSMDGDSPNIDKLLKLSKTYNGKIILDEAHALGVFGKNGCGLIDSKEKADAIFARIITFGKALGSHGAAVLGSDQLKTYLINFSKPLIYTTALAPHAVATIISAYKTLKSTKALSTLRANILFFNSEIERLGLTSYFIINNSAIQSALISGNENVKQVASILNKHGFEVKPILSPTVPKNEERLRFCLHSYNTIGQITEVLEQLKTSIHG